MKASKFTDAQKTFILKQGADGHLVAEIYRQLMGNETAGLVFTDPPYDVPIAGHVSVFALRDIGPSLSGRHLKDLDADDIAREM